MPGMPLLPFHSWNGLTTIAAHIVNTVLRSLGVEVDGAIEVRRRRLQLQIGLKGDAL
jgi:hypothetical protein